MSQKKTVLTLDDLRRMARAAYKRQKPLPAAERPIDREFRRFLAGLILDGLPPAAKESK